MKNIKKALACVAAVGTATLAAATPEVSNVTMVQASSSRLVTITYELSEDAVVTLDVLTNATPNAVTGWVSIGGKAICNAEGAVWRKVTSTDADGNGKYTITWRPDLSWLDESGNGFKVGNGCAKAVVTAWSLDNTPNYMVVDVSAAAKPNTQRYYPAADFLPGGVSNSLYKTTTFLMRKIMAKDVKWTMGSTSTETQRTAAREGTHQVTLTNNYYIGVYPVTQSQWGVVATNSSQKGYYTTEPAMRPMEQVCYNEIRLKANSNADATTDEIANYSWPKAPHPSSFLGLLRSKTGLDFDLPSEAQWEFAARAGNGVGYWGDGSAIKNADTDANLNLLGRYRYNGGKIGTNSGTNPAATCEVTNGTAIVGTYLPNAWGIYDMHGNLWEWCLDWYQEALDQMKDANGDDYNGRVNIDPSNPANYLSGVSASGAGRVGRGGAWADVADRCRSAFRHYYTPTYRLNYYGFRIVCTAGLQ
jgi:formylglycine-generating enzyme required for sulfatase activity